MTNQIVPWGMSLTITGFITYCCILKINSLEKDRGILETPAEIYRNAIQTEIIISESEDGGQIAVTCPDGTTRMNFKG